MDPGWWPEQAVEDARLVNWYTRERMQDWQQAQANT